MRAQVTIDDTSTEIEDDEPYSHDHAAQMLTTLTGATITAYEAGLHAGNPSTKDLG